MRDLVVNTNGEWQVEYAALQYNDELEAIDAKETSFGGDEKPSASGESVIPEEQSKDKQSVSGETPELSKETKPNQVTVTKPENQSPAKSESTGKPKATSPSPSGTKSPNTTETKSPSPSESPDTTETETPSTNQPDSTTPINQIQKYEQEIVQVQAMCTKNMNEVLSGAESSMKQLDKTDSIGVLLWNDKWTKELASTESECDSNFQVVTQNAEDDSISYEIIEEWKQTFKTLKEDLQRESKVKLQQLMGR